MWVMSHRNSSIHFHSKGVDVFLARTLHVCGHVRLTGNRRQGMGFYYSVKRNKHRLEATWTASDFNDQLLLTPKSEGPRDEGNLKSTS